MPDETERGEAERDEPDVAPVEDDDDRKTAVVPIVTAGAGGLAAGAAGAALLAGEGIGEAAAVGAAPTVGPAGVPLAAHAAVGSVGVPFEAGAVAGPAGTPMGVGAVGPDGVPIGGPAGVGPAGVPVRAAIAGGGHTGLIAAVVAVVAIAVVGVGVAVASSGGGKKSADAPATTVAVGSTASPTTAAPTTSTGSATTTVAATSTTAPATTAVTTTAAPSTSAGIPVVTLPACAVGSFVADNVAYAATFATFAQSLGSSVDVDHITGSVTVDIAPDGSMVTTYNQWTLTLTSPISSGSVDLTITGVDTGTITFAADGTYSLTYIDAASKGRITGGGLDVDAGTGAYPAVIGPGTYTCEAGVLHLDVEGAVPFAAILTPNG